MTQTLPDEHGNPIDVTGYEGPPLSPDYVPMPRHYGLYEFSLDFHWHTGIPLEAVLFALTVVVSTIAIIVTITT